MSGGLGWTDYGKKEVIGGYALEFFRRVGKKYGEPLTWHFEPHVADAVFGELVKEARVQVFLQHRLREKGGVTRKGTRIENIAFENGASFRGRIFADASYEGDLMAQAGVAYTWGRGRQFLGRGPSTARAARGDVVLEEVRLDQVRRRVVSPLRARLSPRREKVLPAVDEAKDFHLRTDPVDQSVAPHEEFSPGRPELRNGATLVRKVGKRCSRFLDLVQQRLRCLRSTRFSEEKLERLQQILTSGQAPRYWRLSHSRASRITCS